MIVNINVLCVIGLLINLQIFSIMHVFQSFRNVKQELLVIQEFINALVVIHQHEQILVILNVFPQLPIATWEQLGTM